jgi:colicin import membrane protein
MPEIMPWHKTKLINPEYTRVDLVKEGANSQAHIKLFKSKGGESMELKDILAKMKPEHAAVIQKAIDEAEAEAKKAEAAKKAAEDAVEKMKSEPKEPAAGASQEEILKTVKDPAVKALLETQIAKAKAAEDEVKKARELQLSNEAVTKAKEVPNIGADEATVMEVYKKLKAVDSDLCENVFGIFKSASAMIAEGGVLSEIGKSTGTEVAGDENAAWDKIEKKAEEVAKSSNITQAAAISKVIQDNPELYSEYLKAQQG